jgi:hypothetical protein
MVITEATCYVETGSHPYTSPYLQEPRVTAEPNRLVSIGRLAKRALRIVGGDSSNIEDVRNRWRIFLSRFAARISPDNGG